MTQRVLLLGPDDDARRALHLMLDRAGKQVAATTEVEGASRYLGAHDCDAVIAEGALATELLGATRGSVPPVIAVVRSRDVARSMSLLEAGVDDVVSEPLDELAVTLALRHVATRPRKHVAAPAPTLVGDGAAMTALRHAIERIAAHRATVLVLGESGTGKELVARAIHDASPRRDRKFVAINCAAIPEALLESELFGHTRGAFTDAVRDKVGLFEDAGGGTIFLDEIGELPLALQAKLLRVLQEGELRRVGDAAAIKVDVRVIAATLRDLADDVAEGRFREDLYYRLNVVPIAIPPLRDRTEDIPQLARAFVDRHAAKHGRGRVELTDEAIDALVAQPWPGNVRELENVLERALVLADGPTIDLGFLGTVTNPWGRSPNGSPGPLRAAERGRDADATAVGRWAPENVRPSATSPDTDALSIKKATRELEADLIKRALEATHGNRTNAAKLLEISHRALLYKMKDYGIS